MGTVLSNLIFCETDNSSKQKLYYRTNGIATITSTGIIIKGNTKLSFNTYFNAFFYPVYLRHMYYKLFLSLLLQENAIFAWFAKHPQKKRL